MPREMAEDLLASNLPPPVSSPARCRVLAKINLSQEDHEGIQSVTMTGSLQAPAIGEHTETGRWLEFRRIGLGSARAVELHKAY